MSFFEICGWIGALSYIGAYFLLSIKVISSNKPLFHLLNALGGLCLIINAIGLKDSPNLIVNLIWMLIALFTTGRIMLKSSTG